MEFYGSKNAPISLTRAFPWNSMELGVRKFRWHEQFHGILWNLECTIFDDTSSSREFHGTRSAPISLTRAVPWNSMELEVRQFRWHEMFHGIHAALYRGCYCPKESNPAITKKPAGDVDIPTSHEHRLFNGCNKTCILCNVILAPSWYPSIHYDVIK